MKSKILIVDDKTLSRGVLIKLLKDEFALIEARDGTDAVKKYRAHKPDLVLMDVFVPNLQGIHFLKRILTLDKHAKIIVVSDIVDVDLIEIALHLGVVAYHTKPFDFSKLLLDIGREMNVRALVG